MRKKDGWVEDAQKTIENAFQENDILEFRRELARLTESEMLRVVIVGPYDAGKSSLLGRLLVDNRLPLPEWLTISARRDTFEKNSAFIEGIEFVDTPGLNSGVPDHDALALSVTRTADVALFLLPLNIITSGAEGFKTLLESFAESTENGKYMLNESLVPVLCRIDEGADPALNLNYFREFCLLKRREVVSFFSSVGVETRLDDVFCASPDPLLLFMQRRVVSPEEFDESRNWDGVAELWKRILNASQDFRELRRRATRRFLAHVLLYLKNNLDADLSVLQQQIAVIENDNKRRSLLLQELDMLQAAAVERFRKWSNDFILLEFQTRCENESAQTTEQKLEAKMQKLWDDVFEDAQNIFNKFREELRRSERNAFCFDEVLSDIRVAPNNDISESGTLDFVKVVSSTLDGARNGNRFLAEHKIGLPWNKMSTELTSAKSMGWKKYREATKNQVEKIGSLKQFKDADGHVKVDGMIALAPAVVDVATWFIQAYSEVKRREKEAKEEAELKAKAIQKAAEVVEMARAAIRKRLESAVDSIKAARAQAELAKKDLEEDSARISENKSAIEQLLTASSR